MVASRNSRSPDLLGRVAAFVAAHLPEDGEVCVGLSGGCDSVVLLHLLSRLELGARLTALHVHHGLSPHADAWAMHCAEICRQCAVPLAVQRVAVDRASGLGVEAAARQARYAAFADQAAPILMLAHHQGDQAETVLFNLLRGSGVAGLAGIPAVRQGAGQLILRPLLGEGRPTLEAYAREAGLVWVDDESNEDRRYSRNFMRHDVLPVLKARFPAAEAALARAAGHCAEADGLLAEVAAEDWLRASDGEDARLDLLRQLSPARLKNALRYRLRQLGWRAPASDRLDEFVRQLRAAGPDRHPALVLPDGELRAGQRRLRCLPGKSQTVIRPLSDRQTHQLQSPD